MLTINILKTMETRPSFSKWWQKNLLFSLTMAIICLILVKFKINVPFIISIKTYSKKGTYF